MQNEKIAIIALAIIIIGALSIFLAATYSEEILNNLFPEEKTIEIGDCADVNYIGTLVNGNVFDSSYTYPENKTGGTPLKIFITMNQSETPPTEYPLYSSRLIEGFMEGLIGLKEGETTTIGPIPPEKAYGILPKEGDIIDLSDFYQSTYGMTVDISYEISEIQENVPMPIDFEEMLGSGTTDLYTLRENWHYIGEFIDSLYPSWVNSTVVTKINDTKLWTYVSPPDDLDENFTWIDVDATAGSQTTYPENSTSIKSITNDTIDLIHTPEIGTTITVISDMGYTSSVYTVEDITLEKINVSYTLQDGNKTYLHFDRIVSIQRNNSQNITSSYPPEIIEGYLFSQIREFDNNFKLSLAPLAGETLNFEVEIVEVYKTS